MKYTPFLCLAVALCGALPTSSFVGCSGKTIDEGDPKSVFEDAEEDIKDERYQMALEKLKNVKNKFPYSHYSTLAQLRISDVYFAEESFIEAAGAYETFRDLHPKHPQADYVLFRIGESYYFQLPSTVDRDLSPATKALEAYRELRSMYPASEHTKVGDTRITDCLEKLSEKEFYIGNFYRKRGEYDSAAARFEKITLLYADTSIVEQAYKGWAEALHSQSEQKLYADRSRYLKESALRIWEGYLRKFPKGKYQGVAERWIQRK